MKGEGKMKKTMRITALLLATALVPSMAMAGSSADDAIMQKLEELTRQLTAQQKHIDALEAKLAGDTNTEQAAVATTSPITLGNKAIDQLKIKADLRLRYENREVSQNTLKDTSRNRFRSRVRIGGVWANKAENWEIGIGLASGGSGATSTNATWSEDKLFETTDIRMDYAYVKHHLSDDIIITAGQHKNPYKTSWVLWDSDVRPTGVTLQYGGKTGPFVTAGGYGVRYYGGANVKSTSNTGMMGAGQFGWHAKIGDMKLMVATGVQYWESSVSEDYYTVGDDYNYTIGDLYAKLTIPAGSAKVDLYTQVWNNFGADGTIGQGALGGDLDPEDETLGYVIGAKAKFGAIKVKASYAHIEADSLFGELSDHDFGYGLTRTNLEGFKVGASYNFTKNWAVATTAQFYKTLEKTNDGSRVVDDDGDLYQFDMKYKF
jgi:hypothetical protein